eukprot:Em0020g950a
MHDEDNFSNSSNDTMEGTKFIFSVYAKSISGVFTAGAIAVTLFQILQHLRYYTIPEQQLWVVRILFIVPIYGFCSWLSILFPMYNVYFDAVRSCYEAFVIYNFLMLCLGYVGGEAAIMAEINGKPVRRSFFYGTCCFPKMQYSIRYIRFCKQFTLQFCLVKPVVATATIIMEAIGIFHEGSISFYHGYVYCAIVYNLSVTLALYGLALFYFATKSLLSKYNPVLKFLAVKSIIFLSFWQGLLLTILHWIPFVNLTDALESTAYHNFMITVEMFFASILLLFAFPYKPYVLLHRSANGMAMQQVTANLKDTLNPKDIVHDTIHNFSRVYQQYTQQGDMSGPEDHDHHGNHLPAASSNEDIHKAVIEDGEKETLIIPHSDDEDEVTDEKK